MIRIKIRQKPKMTPTQILLVDQKVEEIYARGKCVLISIMVNKKEASMMDLTVIENIFSPLVGNFSGHTRQKRKRHKRSKKNNGMLLNWSK